jgi:hypothetical protein
MPNDKQMRSARERKTLLQRERRRLKKATDRKIKQREGENLRKRKYREKKKQMTDLKAVSRESRNNSSYAVYVRLVDVLKQYSADFEKQKSIVNKSRTIRWVDHVDMSSQEPGHGVFERIFGKINTDRLDRHFSLQIRTSVDGEWENLLEVKASSLTSLEKDGDAGLGLFVSRSFQVGETISLFGGVCLDNDGPPPTTDYNMRSPQHLLDAHGPMDRGNAPFLGAHMVNDPTWIIHGCMENRRSTCARRANCRFRDDFTMIATRLILAQEELFVIYCSASQYKKNVILPASTCSQACIPKLQKPPMAINTNEPDTAWLPKGDSNSKTSSTLMVSRKSPEENNNGSRESRSKESQAQLSPSSSISYFTEAQEKTIKEALYSDGDPKEVIRSYGADTIQRASLETLRPGVWMNDEVISYYFKMLARSDRRKKKDMQASERCHFFNSFFMTKLLNEGHYDPAIDGMYDYSKVRAWSKKVPGGNIFSLGKIIIPINVGRIHWRCAVIYMQEKQIVMYDSGGSGDDLLLETLLQYVKDEHQTRQGTPLPHALSWRIVNSVHAPQQSNGESDL